MLLSRFWYVVLALGLGAAAFVLFVAAQLYNRSGHRAMSEALRADSLAVSWYLKDDMRSRSSALIPIALSPDVRGGLAKVSPEAKVARDVRDKTQQALKKLANDVPSDLKFDQLWAVDANGRVIASAGDVFPTGEDWELGGYSVVADALHGWIRDDAWVWKGRILRVVARPVEQEVNGEPVGAIVGIKLIDDAFARGVSTKTGAAVGFYAEGSRVASGAPEGFDKANLDMITQDLKQLDDNKDYQEKGRTEPRVVGQHLGVVYARLAGEAWDLGAGYAVGRLAVAVDTPLDFLNKADNTDKKKVPSILIGIAVLIIAGFGLLFSIIEHTRPLGVFRTEAARLAEGKIDVLQPSRFRGAYKKIAADLNDGIEKVSAKGGVPRRAADLEQVLGPIPAQPQMSAFAVPGEPPASGPAQSNPGQSNPGQSNPGAWNPVPPPSQRAAPRIRPSGPGTPQPPSGGVPAPPASVPVSIEAFEVNDPTQPTPGVRPGPPPPPRRPGPPPPPNAMALDGGPAPDELVDWRKVYEEFLTIKKQCGEPTQSLTFDKFRGTLQRNKDALVARHNCTRVKFTVYVKEGKAALKASPVK